VFASRTHVLFAAALLAMWASYALFVSLPKANLPGVAFGAASLADAVLLMLRSRWARPITTILCALIVALWSFSSFQGPALTYLGTLSPADVVISLVPGVVLCLLAVYCCFVAFSAARVAPKT